MIRCNNCRTENIDGSEYCDECGMRLEANPPPAPNIRDSVEPPIYQPPSAVQNDHLSSRTIEGPPPTPPSFTTSTSIPKPAMPARDQRPPERVEEEGADNIEPRFLRDRRNDVEERSAPRPNRPDHYRVPNEPKLPEANAAGSAQTYVLSGRGATDGLRSENQQSHQSANPRVTAKLMIERGGRIGREFPITGIETNIGRWDADSGIFPDVDLDEDDPEAKISRRHARIINHNGQYFIEDLGSTNGTFVNRGRRLLPGKRHMLQNGDEVIVGKTFLKFQILR